MHGNCLQQMFMRGSSKLRHTPHEHHCTFELEFSFLPLSSIRLIRKGLTKSGSAAVMIFTLCRSSSTGILSTAFYKKKIKNCRCKKKYPKFVFCVSFCKKKSVKYISYHQRNTKLLVIDVFRASRQRKLLIAAYSFILDHITTAVWDIWMVAMVKKRQNIIPSLSRRTSSWWEGEHQELVANTPRIYIYTCTYCAHRPSLGWLVLAVCVVTITARSPLACTTFALPSVITRTASLQKRFVYWMFQDFFILSDIYISFILVCNKTILLFMHILGLCQLL